MSEPYQLTSVGIQDLLGSLDFYRACPAFSFLAKQGTWACDELRKALRDERLTTYEAYVRKRLAMLEASFVKHTVTLRNLFGPKPLQPLKDYIGQLLGRKIDQILIRYKEHDKEFELVF